MYNGSITPADVAGPVGGFGAITMLPATGVSNMTSIALGVFICLVVWAVVYILKTRRASV